MDDQGARRTLRAWQCFAVAILVVAVYVLISSRGYVYQDATGPGPGFFPVWVGGLAAAIALVLLATLRRRTVASYTSWEPPTKPQAARIVITIASIALTAVLLNPLGFRITMALFLAVQLRCFGLNSWLKVVSASVLGSILTHYLFQSLLKVQLPIGPFGL